MSEDALVAELADGRTITVPIAWFPRLARRRDPLAGAGRRSGETQESLRRWLQQRESAD